MDINALKARAYDLIALIQQAQNELAQINEAIAQANQQQRTSSDERANIVDEGSSESEAAN